MSPRSLIRDRAHHVADEALEGASYVCAGLLCHALAYRLGAVNATAQSGP